METSAAGVTVKVATLEVTPPDDAVILAEPTLFAFALPVPLMH